MLIKNTLLEIGQQAKDTAALRSNAMANSTTAATGAASPKKVLAGAGTVSKATSTSQADNGTVAATKIAENRVAGITQKAKEAADKATLEATQKLTDKLYNKPKESFGDFKGDTSNLFDHDAELALNVGSKNPLIAVDEAELKNKELEENPTGGATGGQNSMGSTGATGGAQEDVNSGVVGSSTGAANGDGGNSGVGRARGGQIDDASVRGRFF